MVDETKVRESLNDITADRISKETIEAKIQQANALVEQERGAIDVDDDLLEEAKLAWATYLSFQAYGMKIERGAGMLPPQVSQILIELEKIAERFLGYVKSGAGLTSIPQVIELTETIWDTYTDDELDEAMY